MRRADGNPINVLVVDDEPVLAEMVSMALRYEGWNIATAGDGASALESARSQRPDVVVLDVMLPGRKAPIQVGLAQLERPLQCGPVRLRRAPHPDSLSTSR